MSELLGAASFPSGDLLVIDFGLLSMWSGDRVPVLADGLASPDEVARAERAADFEIVGPDAAEVAARIDLVALTGRYAFDMSDGGESIAARVAGICRETGLEATLRALPRMPHHTRVRRLLDDMPGGAEVTYFGGWAVAVRGVPADRPLRVLGQRMDPAGPDAARWHSLWVECLPGEPVRSVPSGYVLVDEAKLMFADPAALNEWRDEEFHDVLIDVAVGSPAEAGSIEVGGALMTGWFTSWGDGAYPVYRDLGRDGELLRVRVELGAPEIVRLRRGMERRWFGDLAKLAIVSTRVTREGSAVGWLYREDPDNDQDSGWRVFAGDETEEHFEDPATNCVLMPLRELIDSDSALEELFDQPAPVAFEREAPGGVFVRLRPGGW